MARKKTAISGVFEKIEGSGVWYIRYRAAGKSVRKRVGSRPAAIELLGKVRSINLTGQGVVAKSAKERTLTHDEIDGSKHTGITVGAALYRVSYRIFRTTQTLAVLWIR